MANIVKNNEKEKWLDIGYEIAFDGACSWNLNNEFAKSFVIFGVDNSSSSHTDNRKNNFLVLGEGAIYGINGSFGSPVKSFTFNFSIARTKSCLNLHYNHSNSYLFVNGK